MSTILVKSNTGWHNYCPVGIATDLVDIDGVRLKTGDVVEILNGNYYDAGIEDCVVNAGQMIVYDKDNKFLKTDKFFVEGWLSADWPDGKCSGVHGTYLIRKTDSANHDPKSHYRIDGE